VDLDLTESASLGCCDPVRHGEHVVNNGGCSEWQTCDGRTKLTTRASQDRI